MVALDNVRSPVLIPDRDVVFPLISSAVKFSVDTADFLSFKKRTVARYLNWNVTITRAIGMQVGIKITNELKSFFFIRKNELSGRGFLAKARPSLNDLGFGGRDIEIGCRKLLRSLMLFEALEAGSDS